MSRRPASSSFVGLALLLALVACCCCCHAVSFTTNDDVPEGMLREKLTALRKLADAVGGAEEEEEIVLGNHDHNSGWPDPGDASRKATAEMMRKATENGDRADFPRLIQPVSFIVFHQKDGVGKVGFKKLEEQVAQLNRAYSGEEAKAGGYAKHMDTNIRFKMAGVRYVENDEYFNLCTLPTTIAVIRPKYMMNGKTHLNVYICWCQHNLGMAWLPYDSWYRQPTGEDHYALGAILHWELLPGSTARNGLYNQGDILTHEIGHCYGLRHPYENDCYQDEYTSDQIDDTPRMSGNPLSTCTNAIRNRDSCPKHPGKDDMSNYMVATADTCRNHFTPGQVAYMQETIRNYKPTLMKQLLPDCVAAVDSTDYSPDLQPCLQGTLKVVDGRQWCRTDPDNNAVWAWACCPSSLDWDQDECRKGTPDFSLPSQVISKPGGAAAPPTTAAPTKAPTKAPTTKTPTKAPTKKPTDPAAALTKSPTKAPTKKPTKAPTKAPTKKPTKAPTRRPTRKPTTRRQARKKAQAKAKAKAKSG